MTISQPTATAAAYDSLAASYDALTADYGHDVWLEQIESMARAFGVSGRKALDLACGTGKSFLPLLARGYDVAASDISESMVAIAKKKAPGVPIRVADMCSLPQVGSFDLITCLNDALNYLLTEEQLRGFFASAARNLASDGVLVFDVNSLRMYRDEFLRDWLADMQDTFIGWNAEADEEISSDSRMTATVNVFVTQGSSWARSTSRHEQRHWPYTRLLDASVSAGLRIVAVRGQRPGAVVNPRFDEFEHHKALYFVVHRKAR
jgi:SAM-dependent methyltransferase